MKNASMLKKEILALNGRGYPAYKSLKGKWDFGSYILSIDHVQSDPFASPSDLSVLIEHPGFPSAYYENRSCRIALQDALLRMFSKKLRALQTRKSGSGKSGLVSVSRPVQEVLERSACTINPHTGALTLRFHAGFPARGRSILAAGLIQILFEILPGLIEHTLIYDGLNEAEKNGLQRVDILTRDQEYIRQEMEKRQLAVFAADGSILPRASGVSDLPMKDARPLQSPDSIRVSFTLPSGRKISGMGIPKGITLIVGGGYHGKSTLLEAIEKGVWNHIEEDGREFVLTSPDAMKIRAEDGRAICSEDISLFISHLPDGKETRCFNSEDASGSTSQAAAVMEAIESGSRLLLMDEDTSATNFMIRDALMAEVVHSEEEPIQPFISRIRPLAEHGISTILAAGSSGAYFEKADLILQMKEYEPFDITEKAKAKTVEFQIHEPDHPIGNLKTGRRIPQKNPALYAERIKVKTNGKDGVSINREMIDTRAIEQTADAEQIKAIGKILLKAGREAVDNQKSMEEILDWIEAQLDKDSLAWFGSGDLARPRRQEITAAFNRWRSQKFKIQENA